MVSPQEIYKKFLLKINKNDTNRNIKVPKSQFVLLFNEQKRKYIDDILEQTENSDDIEDVQEILESDAQLEKLSEDINKTNFKLPTNFQKRVGSYVKSSKGDCKNEILTTWYYKPKDINVLLNNENYNPSFEYRETLAIINKDIVSVYKKDFSIDEIYFTYYREPLDLDRVVVETTRNYESPEQYQLAIQRQQLNEK